MKTISDLFGILRAEAYWTAGIFNSWTEGRGARAFRNCSIKSVDGEFRSKADAICAAEKAIKGRMLSGVRWDTATPTASFCIPHKTGEKIGEVMDAMMSTDTATGGIAPVRTFKDVLEQMKGEG
jgi:hypothetical protein